MEREFRPSRYRSNHGKTKRNQRAMLHFLSCFLYFQKMASLTVQNAAALLCPELVAGIRANDSKINYLQYFDGGRGIVTPTLIQKFVRPLESTINHETEDFALLCKEAIQSEHCLVDQLSALDLIDRAVALREGPALSQKPLLSRPLLSATFLNVEYVV
jgi:hypothetical protein